MATYDKDTRSDDYLEKVVGLTRTSNVSKGGRSFRFASLAVVGNPERGLLGVGRGKAGEVPVAIQKSLETARRGTRRVELNGTTIWYPIVSTHGATTVIMNPAAEGTGVIAGGAMRAVFEVLGVQNILAKVIGSTNPVNVVYATVKGLVSMRSPEYLAGKRGKSVDEIWDS